MKRIIILGCLLAAFNACTTNTGNAIVVYDTIDSTKLRGDTLAFLTEDITYSGRLPCADCSGILTDLNLNTGSLTYTIKRTYKGKKDADSVFVESGTISIEKDSLNNSASAIYALKESLKGGMTYFQVQSDSGLRLLDQKKRKIESAQNYTLLKTK